MTEQRSEIPDSWCDGCGGIGWCEHREDCPKPGQPWEEPSAGRVPPRQCFINARDALNRAFSYTPRFRGDIPYSALTEALDWQRRGLEQLADRQEA